MRVQIAPIYMMTVLTATSVLCGCGSVLRVKQGTAKVPGVPFYSKEARCLHQEVSVMPYYRLTLQTVQSEKVTGSQTATVSAEYYLTDPTAVEFTSLVDGTADVSSMTNEQQQTKLGSDWTAIKGHSAVDVHAKVGEDNWPKYVVSNSTSPKVFVNYKDVYYLNAKNPLSGSAKADYKLASDGTLTEASGEMADDTFKTIVSALPISDLIKSAAGIGLASKSVGGRTLQLKAESRMLKITRFQTVAFEPGCPDHANFDSTPPIGTLIEDVGSEVSTPSKQEDNSVSFSGKIVLPKSTPTTNDKGGTKPAPGNPDTPPK